MKSQAIVYFCGSRVLAHGPADADGLLAEAETARVDGLAYLRAFIAKKGGNVQSGVLRKLIDLQDHGVQSCRVDGDKHPCYLVRDVAGRHGLPIAHPRDLA
jgi:hypothetical protein